MLCLGRAPGALGAAPAANLVLPRGKTVTVDARSSVAQAVAIGEGRTAAAAGPRGRLGPAHRRRDRFGDLNTVRFKIPRPSLEQEIESARDRFREPNRVGLAGVGDLAGGALDVIEPRGGDAWLSWGSSASASWGAGSPSGCSMPGTG